MADPSRTVTPPSEPWRNETSRIRRSAMKLLSRHGLMSLLGRMGIRGTLWRWYCRVFGPEGGILRLELGGLSARFYVHSDWVAESLESFDGEQEVLERLISTLKPGEVVYDVGANLGQYAVFLGWAVGPEGRVIAFEPEPHYCERLRGNAALNGLRNVRICCLALGDRAAQVELLPSEVGKAAPRLAGESQGERGTGQGSKVQVVEGDRFVQAENLPLPRMVKIDVEGFEYAVLKGLRRTLSNPICQVVCCEVHPGLLPEGVGPEEILDLLKSCGFTRFDTLPRPPQQHILAFKA